MASTGDKVVSTQIIDHVDGQPSIVLSNGNWGVFDPKTNMYKDTGIKASPEDDSSAVKYYKLNNDTTPPEAPSQTGGWNSLASLNAALAQAEWAEDPLQTSSTNRFCWVATYGKENIVDTVATEAEGHLVFKPKFTRTNVRLWSNYANSPTIAVVGNEIIITNPDGTVLKQKFASTEAINDLTTLITSLQEQVDGAVYSYSMEGVPTLNTAPTTDWRLDSSGNPITDPATIADIYRTHVGDTYTDLLTYRSYRFSQTGSSGSDPTHYEWKIIEDDALSAALGEIAKLGREKITVFTEQPNSPYKKGDMWLDGEVMLHAIQSSEVFNLEHWVQPYATQVELDTVKTALQSAAADATLAKDNLATLETNLTNMTGTVADAIKDNIISDTELMDLNAELKQLDIDQESLLTTVNYLLNSIYLPATPKATLQTRSNASIAAGGSMDIYQAQISTMIADGVITAQERTNYTSKFNTYKNDLKLLNEAISGAQNAIEGELKRLADEKVDSIEIGGRNLLMLNPIFWQRGAIASATGVVGSSTTRLANIIGNEIGGDMPYVVEFYSPHDIFLFFYDENDNYLGFNGWLTERTFGVTPAGTKKVKFTVSKSDNSTIVVDDISDVKIKLEKGNKATDWTPAPEDVQKDIDDVNTDLTNLGTEIDTAFSNLSITNIEANSLDLSRKSLAKEVADVVTIANTYAVSVTDINAKLDALNTEINKYTGKADSVYPITVTTANRTAIDTAFSNLEASIVALYEAIDKKRVDNIEIGGRNLLLDTSTVAIDGQTKSGGSTGSADNVGTLTSFGTHTFEANQPYTVSFDLKAESGLKVIGYNYLYGSDGQGNYSLGSIEVIDDNIWRRYSLTFSFPIERTGHIQIATDTRNPDTATNVTYSYRAKKLEKGNKPTDWTPAPEDVQADIYSAVIKATYWSIKASTPVIYKDANSATASGVHTPVTVNGELRSGTTTTQGGFISIQPNGGAESTATASPVTIAPTDTEGKTSYTVRLYEKADKGTLLDTMTIPVVFKGSSGINVAMSNEADVLPASSTGEVSDYADTGNVIRVFEGANELAYTKPTTAIVNGASVELEGLTAEQLMTNGDFKTNISGWSSESATSVWNNGALINTASGVEPSVYGRIARTIPIYPKQGDKFYVSADVTALTATPNSIQILIRNGSSTPIETISLNNPSVGVNHRISDVRELTADYTLGVRIYVSQLYSSASEALGKQMRVDNVKVINLTETFGAGNEPTKEECDVIFGGYFEGTAPLSDVALGGNGTYQVYPYSTGITEGAKSVSGLACSFANASNMTADSASITFNIYGLTSSGTPFEFSRVQNFSKSKIGADGEGGINVIITRQGSFRTYWRQIGDQGQILSTPEKVSEIVGGVEIGGVEYIQCKVIIYKGSVDVTASALADPTTLPKWYLNNELMGSVTDTLNIPIIHADGVDDEVRFEYTDINAKNWEGA